MADCQAPIFRNFFDAVIEKGVIDALVAGDNPWSICDQSKSLIQNTIESARKASNKFISISFHSPIVRLRLPSLARFRSEFMVLELNRHAYEFNKNHF